MSKEKAIDKINIAIFWLEEYNEDSIYRCSYG